jgi:glutathione S-transferase
MKLYTSIGPNPRVVRMFAAEKGISFDLEDVDILAGENRRQSYLSINPMGSTPALALPSGQIVTEILAICEYLEEKVPAPVLIGSSPEKRAHVRMWTRRIDLGIVEPMVLGFRAEEGRALFEPRIPLVRREAGSDLKAISRASLRWLESSWDDRTFVAGDDFSLADILLFCFLDFARAVGLTPLADCDRLAGWFERIAARESAAA